jgi:hypothetical protein
MALTEEATLRSVEGPCPYSPDYGPQHTQSPDLAIHRGFDDYPQIHAIAHGHVRGRELLLIHAADQIWVFQGWVRRWTVLLGPAAATGLTPPQYEAIDIQDTTAPGIPTQFEFTPAGVVILPRGGRPYFYDGEVVLPFGYTQVPAPPQGLGPATTGVDQRDDGDFTLKTKAADTDYNEPAVNNRGYAHDSQTGLTTGMTPDFGICGLGTVEVPPGSGSIDGVLLDAQYQAAVQWIDRWGNLSPLSPRSAPITFSTQISTRADTIQQESGRVDSARKQVAWTGLQPGPEGTIARVLCRTKDMRHSGTTRIFEIPSHIGGGATQVGTIPDNSTELFPDNTPDSHLLVEPIDVEAVQPFRLARMAFGRLWAANYEGTPGLLRSSVPGLWGTFAKGDMLFPDPRGGEITGLWAAASGLLVFTETSTYLITPSTDGQRFVSRTLHPAVGCVAPNSIATLPSGLTVWLGREGFFSFDGREIMQVSKDIDPYVKEVSRGRAVMACAAVDPTTKEYRCWVPYRGSKTNNLAFVFDGAGWRERTDLESVAAVTVTQDHRAYMLAAGVSWGRTPYSPTQSRWGVWVLDRENFAYTPSRPGPSIETGWLLGLQGQGRASPLRVTVWLRESVDAANVTVIVYRDWRKRGEAAVTKGGAGFGSENEYVTSILLTPEDDPPPLWGTAVYGDTAVRWVRRRPFWRKVELWVPSCEVFKLEMIGQDDEVFEFIGLSIDSGLREGGGARLPP